MAANKKLDIQILRIADDHAAADVAERVIRADDVPAAHALDVIPGSVLTGAARTRAGRSTGSWRSAAASSWPEAWPT